MILNRDRATTKERVNGGYRWEPDLGTKQIMNTTNAEGARFILTPMTSNEVQVVETPEMKSSLEANCTSLLVGIEDPDQLEKIFRDVTMYDDRFDQDDVAARIESGEAVEDAAAFVEQAPAHLGVVLNKKLLTIAIDASYREIVGESPDRQFVRSTRIEKIQRLKNLAEAGGQDLQRIEQLGANLEAMHAVEYDLHKPILNEGINTYIRQIEEFLLVEQSKEDALKVLSKHYASDEEEEVVPSVEGLLNSKRDGLEKSRQDIVDRSPSTNGQLSAEGIDDSHGNYLTVLEAMDISRLQGVTISSDQVEEAFKELFVKTYEELAIGQYQDLVSADPDRTILNMIFKDGLATVPADNDGGKITLFMELEGLQEQFADDPYRFWHEVLNNQTNRFADMAGMKTDEWKQKSFQAFTNGTTPVAGWRVFAKEAMAQLHPDNGTESSIKRGNVATAHGANSEIQILNVDDEATQEIQGQIANAVGYFYMRHLSLMKQRVEVPEYAKIGDGSIGYEASPFGIAEQDDERPILADHTVTVHKQVVLDGIARDVFLSIPASEVLLDSMGDNRHKLSYETVEFFLEGMEDNDYGNEDVLYFKTNEKGKLSRTFLQEDLQNSSVLLSLPGQELSPPSKAYQVAEVAEAGNYVCAQKYKDMGGLYAQVTSLQQKYKFGGQLIVKVGVGENGEVGIAHYTDHKHVDGSFDTKLREGVYGYVLRNGNENMDIGFDVDKYMEESEQRENSSPDELLGLINSWDDYKWQYRARPLIKKIKNFRKPGGAVNLIELREQVYSLVDQKEWAEREMRGEAAIVLKGHGGGEVQDEVLSFYEGEDKDLQHMLQFEFPWDLTQKLEQALTAGGAQNSEISPNTMGIIYNGAVVAPAFEKTMREYVTKEFERERVLPMLNRVKELESRFQDVTIQRLSEVGHDHATTVRRAIDSLNDKISKERERIGTEVEAYLGFIGENEGIHHMVSDDAVDQQLHQVHATNVSDVSLLRESKNTQELVENYTDLRSQTGESIKQALVDKHTKNSLFLNLLRRLEPGVLGGALEYAGKFPDQLLNKDYAQRLSRSRLKRVGRAFRVPGGVMDKAISKLNRHARAFLLRSDEDPLRRFVANRGLDIPIGDIASATLNSVGSYQVSTPKNVGEMTGTNKPAILPSSLFGLKVGDIMSLIGPAMPEDFYRLLAQNMKKETQGFEQGLEKMLAVA